MLKQALPYVRLVGESWPLPVRRAFFEHQALSAQRAVVPAHVPKVFHFDETLALTVMAYLTPHIILRKGLIRGTVYPRLADHMATFMAETLFATSDLGQPAAAKKKGMALFCDNTELCRITEDLVFTDPWRVAEANRWTSPQLDATAASVRADGPWKRAAQEYKLKFLGEAQALIHGDLHSGSIMVTEAETYAIDPEFAFYGPMGFDVGALLGNLYLAFFAQSGHEARVGARDDYRELDPVDRRADLDAVRPAFPRAVEHPAWQRNLRARPVRRRRRTGRAERGAGRLYAPSVRGFAGLRRLQDDPAHPRAGPCRGPGEHRPARPARGMREAGAKACPHLHGRRSRASPTSRRRATRHAPCSARQGSETLT